MQASINTIWRAAAPFLLVVSAATAGWCEAAESGPAAVEISRQGDRIEIGNRFLARAFTVQPGLATCAVTNRLTGRRFAVQGPEFLLDLGEGRSVSADEFRLEAVEPDAAAGKLTFRLRHPARDLRAAVSYEIRPDEFFLRKRLRLETGSTLVRAVDVERLGFPGASLAPLLNDCVNTAPVPPVDRLQRPPIPGIWDIGLGQPVFVAGQLFLGLEHPAGHNAYDQAGTVSLRHFPGRAGSVECKAAVLGVAADRPRERVEDAFLRYVASLRRRPVARWTEFFFDSQRFDKEARRIVDAARDAFVRRGVRLDCVTINGWAEPAQGIMEPPRACPDFLRQLTDYTRKQLGCGLGLHIYTTGCRSESLRDWIAERFDMAYVEPGPKGRGAYCLADPRAESLLTANLGRYVREHGVAMYYYDWGCFACRAGNHRGHGPGYGTEAIADAFLRHLQAMRAARPGMFLCDTGWFSPWWLEWYDAVFFAGGDWNARLDGPPAYATVDFLGAWRDHVMKQRLERRPWFPATGYINHGAISHNWRDWHRQAIQPRQAFVDYVAMMFLLGPQIAEYILALSELSEEHRDDLAAVHRWGLARDSWLLADTRPLGGDPMRGEAYGFAHIVEGNRGVIGVRNPTVFARSLKLVCDEKAGFWPAPCPLVAMTTYPHTCAEKQQVRYGETLELRLSPHELRVLEFAPQEGLCRPMTLGCREQLLESGPQRTVVALLGSPGSAVQLVSPAPIEEVRCDGKPCPVSPGARQVTINLPPSGKAPEAKADFSLREGEAELALRFSTEVPGGARAHLVLLVEATRAGSSRLEASIQCAGKPLEVESPHLRLGDSAGRSGGRRALARNWSLFRAALPTGHADLECLLRPARPDPEEDRGSSPPAKRCQGLLWAFIDTERELPQIHRLEIRHAAPAAAPLPLLPLDRNAVQFGRHEVIAARPVTIPATPASR